MREGKCGIDFLIIAFGFLYLYLFVNGFARRLRHQGRCLTCAGRLERTDEVDQSDSIRYYPEDREAGFVLLWYRKARSSLQIRTHRQDEMWKHRKQKGLSAAYT